MPMLWRSAVMSGSFATLLLAERPNGDFGHTLMRQFHVRRLAPANAGGLAQSRDARVAEIAAKAGKEVAYHLERSADLVIRLGDGSDEAMRAWQAALDTLWPYTGEMMTPDAPIRRWQKPGSCPIWPVLRATWDGWHTMCWPRRRWSFPKAASCRKAANRVGIGTSGAYAGDHASSCRAPTRTQHGRRGANLGVAGRSAGPEIPVISVIELGIVREVVLKGDAVVVTVTPTYSGCRRRGRSTISRSSAPCATRAVAQGSDEATAVAAMDHRLADRCRARQAARLRIAPPVDGLERPAWLRAAL